MHISQDDHALIGLRDGYLLRKMNWEFLAVVVSAKESQHVHTALNRAANLEGSENNKVKLS